MKYCSVTLAAVLSSLVFTASADPRDELKAFPEAMEGLSRHVILLDPQQQEANYKVEIIAGKTMEVDCNHHLLGGQWQEQTVTGWGYTYYQLDQVSGPRSTLMACPDNTKREAFVQVGGEGLMLRYNSKLPVVVYAPSDVEVRYRIWTAGETHEIARP